MTSFSMICALLVAVIVQCSSICGSEIPPSESPSGEIPYGGDVRNNTEWEHVENPQAEMSRAMEHHLLRMLKLSSRPLVGATETSVPGYVRALQNAVDVVSTSSSVQRGEDLVTWAVKAVQGIALFQF